MKKKRTKHGHKHIKPQENVSEKEELISFICTNFSFNFLFSSILFSISSHYFNDYFS